MPRIRCHYVDCVFLEDKYCGAAAVEIDPDSGCLTYSQVDAVAVDDVEDWEDEDLLDEEEEEEDLYDDEEEDDDDWEEDTDED